MIKTISCLLTLALILIAEGAPWPAAAQTLSSVDHAAASKKPAKKQKKPTPSKQAEPGKPKEPWELPMTVVIVRQSGSQCEPICQEWIAAQGQITSATPGLFRKVLKRLGTRKLPVLIDSPGGNVMAALEIGRMLRKADLDVAVASIKYESCKPGDKQCRLPEASDGKYWGHPDLLQPGFCASACPLILAAGRKRIASFAAYVGVHQIKNVWTQEHIRYRETYRVDHGKKKLVSRKVVSRKTDTRVSYGLDKSLRKKLGAYLDEMGVSRDLLSDMEKAPYSSVYWLGAVRSRELALLTDPISELAYSDRVNTCRTFTTPPRHCVMREMKLPPPKPAEPMTVARVRAAGACEPQCPEWIMADGAVTPDTPKQFRDVLSQLGVKKLPVVLNSKGGDFDAALEIGRMIREKGLDTATGTTDINGCNTRDSACRTAQPSGLPFSGLVSGPGDCGGECLLVLAGGKKRYGLFAGQTFFGPPESLRTRKPKPTALNGAEDYLRDMSVSPDLLLVAQPGSQRGPAFIRDSDLMNLGLSTERSSPRFLTAPESCNGVELLSNCVARPHLQKPPPPEQEMVVVRMRSKEPCRSFCPEWIMAQGIIIADTPERFRKLLQEAGASQLPVVFHSAGGDLDAALEIGRMIRAKGLDTVIAAPAFAGCFPRDPGCSQDHSATQPYSGSLYNEGECSGTCLFALAGGTQRHGFWITHAVLAPSKWFATRRTDSDGPGLIEDYMAEMGISPLLMSYVRKYNGVVLKDEDMLQFGLSTDLSSPATMIDPSFCMANPAPSHCIRREGAS